MDDPQYIFGVIVNKGMVEIEAVEIESETKKTIRVRHGGRTFAGQTIIHKQRNRNNIHRTPQAALTRFVNDMRGSIEREEKRLASYRDQLVQATTLAEVEVATQ